MTVGLNSREPKHGELAKGQIVVDQLLTVKEAADRLALKEATIRLWLAQRRLPVVRCGRAVRIPAKAVERFILEHTTPARE